MLLTVMVRLELLEGGIHNAKLKEELHVLRVHSEISSELHSRGHHFGVVDIALSKSNKVSDILLLEHLLLSFGVLVGESAQTVH
jgi:hypothetical protein